MDSETHYLSELKPGEEAVVVKVLGHGAFRKRITEMGFVKGKKVSVIKRAPLQDPVEYEIMGYRISLRNSEAEMVEIVSSSDFEETNERDLNRLVIAEEELKHSAIQKGHEINIALVGNPNSGKTTLFNILSHSHEHVGNYSGVTVDAKKASTDWKGYHLNITDLPGTYSITEYSPEELFVRNHIFNDKPDIVINVIDASNLERNLFLTTQLIDMDIKVVIALNMYDELEEKGIDFDYNSLGKMIGIPMIPTVASKGMGLSELQDKIVEVYEDADPTVRHIHINYGQEIEGSIRTIQNVLWKNASVADRFSSRYLAIKLLEGDKNVQNHLNRYDNFEEIKQTASDEIERLEQEYSERSETIITDAKYGFIDGALKETLHYTKVQHKRTKDLDDVLTHKVWGLVIFFAFLFLIFEATFSIGQYPMDWIDAGIGWFGDIVAENMADGPLKDLLIQGVINGVGGVIVFLPNILILFFCISLMEDTGYMARAAFIMDKLMHRIGLHGKSFIPLVMGFGCNVPAIMATRTLDNRTDRLLTMFITPFMSCSARLPIYILLVSAFFEKNQALVLMGMYLIGIIVAILTALVLNHTRFKKKEVPFVMELPPYRIPTAKSTFMHMWEKGGQYLQKMGTVILGASIIVWALGYFPREANYTKDYETLIEEAERKGDDLVVEQLELAKEAEHQSNSYIGRIGHVIEPVIEPLGFDWKMGVSLFTGAAAKEIVVSTMGVLYQADREADEESSALCSALQKQTYSSGTKIGQKVFTPLVAFCFMLFALIYMPCIATVVTIARESSWKWALGSALYTIVLAWVITFAVYQIGNQFV